MKLSKNRRRSNKMYLACSYMLNTKDDDMSRYKISKISRPYENRDNAFSAGKDLIKEAYDKIMRGVTFPIINYDKNNISILETTVENDVSLVVVYCYENGDYETLCFLSIETLEIDSYFGRVIIRHCDAENDIVHVFCRYGLFWYLVTNNEIPLIVKRFWWFTSLDKMVCYISGYISVI